MKRCPTCNQLFEEDWLSFCTQDGTTLIDDSSSSSGPPPTMMGPPLPPSISPNEQPTINLPGSSFSPAPPLYAPPPAPYAPPVQPWQPPPPPPYASGPTQTLAIWSLVCGVFSMTIGWCCYLGVISGPVAIVLGLVALSQIKKDPEHFTGRPLAIGGIVTGSLYFVFLILLILVWGIGFAVQGLGH